MHDRIKRLFPVFIASSLLLAACGSDSDPATTEADTDADAAASDSAVDCSATIEDGVFTVATGNPAFFPWVIDDAPESGEGFESAVAYAVAEAMGFQADAVAWVRTDFDAAIQPGPKDFDVNLQQFSITDERKETIDFSLPYYTSNQAIVALAGSAAEGATSIADLKTVKFGAQAGTTSLDFIINVIQPDAEPFVYDDNVAAKAALEANQIDAAVFDLPTALFVSAVEIEGSSVIGQFPAETGGTTDQFGMVLEKDSPLTSCVNNAIEQISDDGTLATIQSQWLADNTGAPVITE
ncbi:MAG: polar amino acid transport system substrate-binding protein [Acidimicrobiales bacterium]|jgi:polar amino acid transport system substrate-binding protein